MHGQPVDAEVTTIFDNALKSKSRGDKSDIPVMILQDIALSGLFRRCGLCKKNARCTAKDSFGYLVLRFRAIVDRVVGRWSLIAKREMQYTPYGVYIFNPSLDFGGVHFGYVFEVDHSIVSP